MSKSGKIFVTLATVLFGAVLIALPALAQVDLGINYSEGFGLTTTDIRTTVGRIINAFFGLLGIIAVLIILYAGFIWMTAGGDSSRVDQAKTMIRNGVIGLIIVMSAYAIALFVVNAIVGGTGAGGGPGGGGGGGGGGLGSGGGAGFMISGITPGGPGPGNAGWPKNYNITLSFNSAPSSAALDTNIVVERCNPRLSGGTPQVFDEGDCIATNVSRVVDGNRIIIEADGSPEDDPTDFEGDYWYRVNISGSFISATGTIISCMLPGYDIAGVTVPRGACERAVAFNDLRDVAAPTVSVSSPASSPRYCANITPQIPVLAIVRDDFLPAYIDFNIEGGGADTLIDSFGFPHASEVNPGSDNPFSTVDTFIDAFGLSPGLHALSAVGYDGAGQPSAVRTREFGINVPHCCNEVQDSDETGIDCGGDECGGCDGSACTSNDDCIGFCNLVTGLCENRPVILTLSEEDLAAGPGTNITIGGNFFGSRPGTVVFIGDEANPGDDITIEACSPSAWSNTSVVVTIPVGAVTGPLELRASSGASDRTDDDYGTDFGAFIINDEVKPSICYIEPSSGSLPLQITVHGSAFGDAIGDSIARVSGTDMDVVTWAPAEVETIVPATLSEGVYPVRLLVDMAAGPLVETNEVLFTLRRPDEADGPRIERILPDSGPVGSYVTILGSGFGSRRGSVNIYSTSTDDVALGGEPVCANNWSNNYIVVKIPEQYIGEEAVTQILHQIEVETSAPSQVSNRVGFTVNDAPLAPGICSISPSSGPPTINVTVTGEFPAVPAGEMGVGLPGLPDNSLRFYLSGRTPGVDLQTIAATRYHTWNRNEMSAVVPIAADGTWPVSGPVYLVSNNEWAGNPIPFTVQNCNESGGCAEGTACCNDGACRSLVDEDGNSLPDACRENRDSAFGWNFSTNVLPDFPTVVRRSSCDAVAGVTQSPTPAKSSTDACLDAWLSVEFDVQMNEASLETPGSIIFEECGNGSSVDCTAAVDVPFAGTITIDDAADGGTLLFFHPQPGAYPIDDPTTADDDDEAETGHLRPGYWYRATLVSDPAGDVGIIDEDGRYLDGDYDYRQGGNFVWYFRARNSVEACDVSSVLVTPSRYLFEEEGEERDFNARPQSSNCNILGCSADGPYNIDWDANPGLRVQLNPLAPGVDLNFCDQTVEAIRETSDTPEELSAELIPLIPGGRDISREGISKIHVAFADPRVEEVWPTEGCAEACTNSAIGVRFNVAMNAMSLTNGVNMYRCRNASCNPPFESTLGLGVSRAATSYIEEGGRVVGVELEGRGNLLESTYYIVRVQGGDEGVVSSSNVYLTGLNSPGYYQWTFRTKDDPEACEVTRTALSPLRETLYYVGQRLGINLTAFGPSDECSPRGQRLNPNGYNWSWDIDPRPPEPVLEGFIRADEGGVFGVESVGIGSVVDTAPLKNRGCTGLCTAMGSSSDNVQCGNGGVRETGEDCDDGDLDNGDGCSDICIMEGVLAGACGNGVLNPAVENCEAVEDPALGPGVLVFPPGCKDPAVDIEGLEYLNGRGCVMLGSEEGGSVCGDGIRADGEACDDGNRRDGDGCSSNCLNEGTNPICGVRPADDEVCTAQCGNGRIEPGEECDGGDGCSDDCLLEGTAPCPADPAPGAVCCGNDRQIDPGEACDDDNTVNGDGCSSRCLLEGSSAFYSVPSFCGDGIVGLGEYEACELNVEPNFAADPYQVVVSANLEGGGVVSSDVIVPAYIDSELGRVGLPDDSVGKAEVTLSCTCDTRINPDAFCDGLNDLDLACANSGCCVTRPKPTFTAPTRLLGACRNAVITVEFDKKMDAGSLQTNFVVGQRSAVGDGKCTEEEGIDELLVATAGNDLNTRPRGLLARAWRSVTNFVHSYIIRPIFGADGDPIYCPVPGRIETTLNGDGNTVLNYYPGEAYDAGAQVIAMVGADAISVEGASVGVNAKHPFTPGADICSIQKIEIDPESDLFSSISTTCDAGVCPDIRTYTARALSRGDEEITSTDGYGWTWEWQEQASGGARGASSIVVGLYPDDSDAGTERSQVWVRGTLDRDDYQPVDGEAVVEVKATINDGSIFEDDGATFVGRSEVVVMLCNNPWPDWRRCSDAGDTLSLPWDSDPANMKHCSSAGERLWYPFYDVETGVKFYYCRDGSSAGDSTPALPAIKTDDIVRLSLDDSNVFAEYLFTFERDREMPSGDWENDAIGFRLTSNMSHLGINDWYRSRGFFGSPTQMKVGMYDALQEGRTIYTSAPSLNVRGDIYSNVYVFSFNDGAASETVSVFNQILNRIDFNYNLLETGVCKYPVGVEAGVDEQMSCDSDLSCGDGWCDIPETKLARDLKRWSDIHEIRNSLLSSRNDPTLQEGTFIRGRSYSVWPSWKDALSSQLGYSVPVDPLNRIASCEEPGYDQTTCWNEINREFVCNSDSHIYRYHYVSGGAEISFRKEYGLNDEPPGTWAGSTCLDMATEDLCTGREGCTWIQYENDPPAFTCTYAEVKVFEGNENPRPFCTGVHQGRIGECGDGSIDADEDCEVGDTRWDVRTCTIGGEDGVMEERCLPDCKGYEVSTGICVLGNYCGDGRVTGVEDCDDGDLNGTYGHCNSVCDGPAFRCGDGFAHPSEACDCRELNGRYTKNGVLAPFGAVCTTVGVGAPSCSWDCQTAAPRCGDGIVNGPEQCDGGFQESRGVCRGSGSVAHPAGNTCSNNEDCGAGGTCVTCEREEQRYRRSCVSDECSWGQWSCTAAGVCGNGTRDEGEECDDGNLEDDDSCTSTCEINVCGDGHVNWGGGELCDNGALNNVPCAARYGSSCPYCTSACLLGYVSGGYCGDGIVQDSNFIPPGYESCEPATSSGGVDRNQICMSTRPEDLSFGAQTGYGICSTSECVRGCEDGESEVCEIAGFARDIPGPYESCSSAPASALEFCVERQSWINDLTKFADFPDECDPDDDNDGVPDVADCEPNDPNSHPRYVIPGTSIVIPAGVETCALVDENCNGTNRDLPPGVYFAADIVFAFDLTGSMDVLVREVLAGILDIAREFRGYDDHKFGIVYFAQDNLIDLNYYQSEVLPLGDIDTFIERLEHMDTYWSVAPPGGIRWKRGSDEPMFASAGFLMTHNSNYDAGANPIGWREDAHPFVVIVTDEQPGVGGNSPDDDPPVTMPVVGGEIDTFGTIDQVAAKSLSCRLRGCKPDGSEFVEMFVISKANYEKAWCPALQGCSIEAGGAIDYSGVDRYINIDDFDRGSDVAREFRETIFNSVCTDEGAAS